MTGHSGANELVPHVLFIDDESTVSRKDLLKFAEPVGVDPRIRHPEDVLQKDLEWAHLVVVDYFLASWPARDETESAARAPRDGLAVAANLRSRLSPPLGDRAAGRLPDKAVAFVLWSSHLSEASFGLPDVLIPHLFARENGLEWAFSRRDVLSKGGFRDLAALGLAVASLPDRWRGGHDGRGELWKLLGIADEAVDWQAVARDNVLSCHPPVHELGERSRGMAALRWLLHRIFPYPCFLLDERSLAARLRADVLDESDAAALYAQLRPFEYKGALSDFGGQRRWWRAGVEDWIFESTDGDPGDLAKLRSIVREGGGKIRTNWFQPVRYINEALELSPSFAEVSEVVRLQPDDWPPYADSAFGRILDVRESEYLASLVEPADRYLLERG